MPGLLDIAPLFREIELRGEKMTIRGIGANGVVYLLNRFPVLRAILTKKELKELTVEGLIAMAPEAVSAIIATGFGFVGKDAVEQATAEVGADNLGLDEKIYVLREIMEVTLPRGVGPFVEMISEMAVKAEELGKAVDMKLGGLLSSASQTATRPSTLGNTPPAS